MTKWHMGRTGTALGVALSISLAACGGDAGESARDTAMFGGAAADTADTGMTGGAAAAAPGAMSDEQIMTQVGGSNGIEIAAGEIAAEKATNADVKQFARDMVEEHQRLQAQVDSLGMSLNVAPQATAPDSLADALDDARNRLTEQAAGADFDRMYMEMQVQAHENTLNLLNQASAATQNAEIRSVLEDAIPVVQQHLDRARQVLNGLGTAG